MEDAGPRGRDDDRRDPRDGVRPRGRRPRLLHRRGRVRRGRAARAGHRRTRETSGPASSSPARSATGARPRGRAAVHDAGSRPSRRRRTCDRPNCRVAPRTAARRTTARDAGPPAYHRGMAALTRADVEHVAYLARLGLTEEELAAARGPAQPHPRPVREARRARHRRDPADGADDRAREHPARGRRRPVDAARGRPGQRPRARRRLLRRAGDPRRRRERR